jgi:Na+-driven multidrug efflux pump
VNIFSWGLIGAWVALALDQYTRSVVIILRFHSGKWKQIKAGVDGKAAGTLC